MDPCRLCQRPFRNTDGPACNSTRDKKDKEIDELRASLKRLLTHLNDMRETGFNCNHLIQFQSSRLLLHFGYCVLVDGVPHHGNRKLTQLPPHHHPMHSILSNEMKIIINCTMQIQFSRQVYRGDKTGTIRDSVQAAIICLSLSLSLTHSLRQVLRQASLPPSSRCQLFVCLRLGFLE